MAPAVPSDPDLATLEHEHPVTQLAHQLAALWRRGWHPLDVARLFGTDNPIALTILTDCLSLDRQRWHPEAAPLWIEQADTLGADRPWWSDDRPYWSQLAARLDASALHVRRAATFFALVAADAPDQPQLEAPPDEPGWRPAGHGADEGVLAKVRGLLAKAESTDFEYEAEALAAKAQELIARHAIDIALLAGDIEVPGGRRVYIDPPYARAKFLLLAGIARANGCRSVWHGHLKTATVIGHRHDLHLVDVLFTSLLLQGTSAVLAAGPQGGGVTGSRTRSWRNAFWQGFAHRVGQRLEAATTTARAEHERETGDDLLPVLTQRDEAVDQALAEAFPSLGSLRVSMSNPDGLLAGHRSADRAELTSERHVGGHPRPALPA